MSFQVEYTIKVGNSSYSRKCLVEALPQIPEDFEKGKHGMVLSGRIFRPTHIAERYGVSRKVVHSYTVFWKATDEVTLSASIVEKIETELKSDNFSMDSD